MRINNLIHIYIFIRKKARHLTLMLLQTSIMFNRVMQIVIYLQAYKYRLYILGYFKIFFYHFGILLFFSLKMYANSEIKCDKY